MRTHPVQARGASQDCLLALSVRGALAPRTHRSPRRARGCLHVPASGSVWGRSLRLSHVLYETRVPCAMFDDNFAVGHPHAEKVPPTVSHATQSSRKRQNANYRQHGDIRCFSVIIFSSFLRVFRGFPAHGHCPTLAWRNLQRQATLVGVRPSGQIWPIFCPGSAEVRPDSAECSRVRPNLAQIWQTCDQRARATRERRESGSRTSCERRQTGSRAAFESRAIGARDRHLSGAPAALARAAHDQRTTSARAAHEQRKDQKQQRAPSVRQRAAPEVVARGALASADAGRSRSRA